MKTEFKQSCSGKMNILKCWNKGLTLSTGILKQFCQKSDCLKLLHVHVSLKCSNVFN